MDIMKKCYYFFIIILCVFFTKTMALYDANSNVESDENTENNNPNSDENIQDNKPKIQKNNELQSSDDIKNKKNNELKKLLIVLFVSKEIIKITMTIH